MHYSLVTDKTFVKFDDLTSSAKDIARLDVLSHEIYAMNLLLDKLWIMSVNDKINNKNLFHQVLRQKQQIKIYQIDVTLLDKFIVGNLCDFTVNGNYITYSK